MCASCAIFVVGTYRVLERIVGHRASRSKGS